MLILGIDPGSIYCGYGCIETDGKRIKHVISGRISLSKSDPLAVRLKNLYSSLEDVIAQCSPDVSAVEQVFFAKSVKSALSLGQARGVVLAALAATGMPVYEYSALEVKKSVVGYGRAEKVQVQKMVTMLLALKHNPGQDDADALAVAICHAHNRKGLNGEG